jgi:threonine synthase
MDSFVSTRGGSPASLSQALDAGLAPDGGLYVPAGQARLGTPAPGLGPTFVETARWAARQLVPSVPGQDLDAVVVAAFDFDVPVVEVEQDLWVMELFHGPTHAFKDVGARFMARLMARTLPAGHERTACPAIAS